MSVGSITPLTTLDKYPPVLTKKDTLKHSDTHEQPQRSDDLRRWPKQSGVAQRKSPANTPCRHKGQSGQVSEIFSFIGGLLKISN